MPGGLRPQKYKLQAAVGERRHGSPRAFHLLLADGLYAKAPFVNLLLAHGKHALVVLKDERRDLYQDASGLLAVTCRRPRLQRLETAHRRR